MSATKPKPCPFCGGMPRVLKETSIYSAELVHDRRRCLIDVCISGKTVAEVVRRWNRRAKA